MSKYLVASPTQVTYCLHPPPFKMAVCGHTTRTKALWYYQAEFQGFGVFRVLHNSKFFFQECIKRLKKTPRQTAT